MRDQYKVNIINECLTKMKVDDCYLARLKGDDTKAINIGEEALLLLKNYYSSDTDRQYTGREIKLAEVAEDLIATDNVMYEDGCLNFEYEMWFDVDKYFGTNTRCRDDCWLNFYTDWHPDGSICAWYAIETDDDSVAIEWDLLPEEERILREKMETKAEELGFLSLAHMWVEDWK